MDKIFAALVQIPLGRQVFYIGEAEIEKAKETLMNAQPDVAANAVLFELAGSTAEFLRLEPGTIQQWVEGSNLVLENLTGPVAK